MSGYRRAKYGSVNPLWDIQVDVLGSHVEKNVPGSRSGGAPCRADDWLVAVPQIGFQRASYQTIRANNQCRRLLWHDMNF